MRTKSLQQTYSNNNYPIILMQAQITAF